MFTGALAIPRREASDMAAVAGCHVAGNVSKKTTILVVGTQDRSKLKGYEKSTKHRRRRPSSRTVWKSRYCRRVTSRNLSTKSREFAGDEVA